MRQRRPVLDCGTVVLVARRAEIGTHRGDLDRPALEHAVERGGQLTPDERGQHSGGPVAQNGVGQDVGGLVQFVVQQESASEVLGAEHLDQRAGRTGRRAHRTTTGLIAHRPAEPR